MPDSTWPAIAREEAVARRLAGEGKSEGEDEKEEVASGSQTLRNLDVVAPDSSSHEEGENCTILLIKKIGPSTTCTYRPSRRQGTGPSPP